MELPNKQKTEQKNTVNDNREKSQLAMAFISHGHGEGVAQACNEIGEQMCIKATQTGYNADQKKYYAFVFYKNN